MKKTLLASALLLASGAANANVFEMFDGTGAVVGVPDYTITDVRDFGAGTWELSTTQPFFGIIWTAEQGTVYDTAGNYTFDTGSGVYSVDLAEGYTLGHILFNWGAVSAIDVVNIWDANGDSIDVDGDGVPGLAMIDGAFVGFNANFSVNAASYEVNPAVVPVPAAVWLFGSGLLGLVGVARRKKAA